MRTFLIFIAVMIGGVAMARQASGPIEEFIAAELPVSGAPGVTYAVTDDGALASGAHGEILQGSGRKMTTDTPFVIGSISKSFTAMAVMMLVEDGRVDLDTAISTYLPGFASQPGSDVTIRQLLSHTSGYSTYQGNDRHKDENGGASELSKQVELIAGWPLAHEPGTRWQYSNANYLILGALIEEISGEDYASFVNAEILAPIGMAHSFVADGQLHEEMAVGHTPWFGMKRAVKDNRPQKVTAPAGGIVATAPDLALYLAVMLNGQDDIISAESKTSMLSPASDASPFYGFGWYLDTERQIAYHAGISPGVETLAALYPAERKGSVALVNSGSGFGFASTLHLREGITAIGLGLDPGTAAAEWGPKSLYLIFALLPVFFVLSLLWAATHRDGLRAKSGAAGAFSLWFPLLMTIGVAVMAVYMIPQFFGVPLRTLQIYQPDFVLMLIATAVTGVFWAVCRLGLYYLGR
ncbi:serine hydrolase domain-containing protein [Parvularcula marina]|uniref:serine hydrolase domain-containing protein n=1 Tax=Parvularcula marina TaxID=2292771 RepID=UPI0035127487